MPKSGAVTRKAILDAANRIVQEQGADALTLEAAAREAGISKGGLLYHYHSRDALIAGMIQDYLERFTADYEAAAQEDGEESPGRWTRAYLTTTWDDHQRIPHMSSGLLAAAASNPVLLEPIKAAFASWVSKLEVDGLDASAATLVRLAVDGLWLVEMFGLAAPGGAVRQQVRQALEALIARETGEGAALKPQE